MATAVKTRENQADLQDATARQRRFSASADNDNAGGHVIEDGHVLRAARFLVKGHSAETPVELSAFDAPHAALTDIAAKIELLAQSHALSGPLVRALRAYIVENAGKFARQSRAKPIFIQLSVKDRIPARRFKNGMTELAFIGRSEARVEGSSSVNVRLTNTGTAMTSNAADVDAMFANVRERGLWLRFEAPTKEELDGLMSDMETAMVEAVQAMGGTLDAQALAAMIETLREQGPLTPEVEALIKNLLVLQEYASGRMPELTPEALTVIVRETAALMTDPAMNAMIPATVMDAAAKILVTLSREPAILAVLVESGMAPVLEQAAAAMTSEKLEATIEALVAELANPDLAPDTIREIAELVESVRQQMEKGEVAPADIAAALLTRLESMLPSLPETSPLAQTIAAVRTDLATPVALSQVLPVVLAIQQQNPSVPVTALEIVAAMEKVLQKFPEAIRFDKTAMRIEPAPGPGAAKPVAPVDKPGPLQLAALADIKTAAPQARTAEAPAAHTQSHPLQKPAAPVATGVSASVKQTEKPAAPIPASNAGMSSPKPTAGIVPLVAAAIKTQSQAIPREGARLSTPAPAALSKATALSPQEKMPAAQKPQGKPAEKAVLTPATERKPVLPPSLKPETILKAAVPARETGKAPSGKPQAALEKQKKEEKILSSDAPMKKDQDKPAPVKGHCTDAFCNCAAKGGAKPARSVDATNEVLKNTKIGEATFKIAENGDVVVKTSAGEVRYDAQALKDDARKADAIVESFKENNIGTKHLSQADLRRGMEQMTAEKGMHVHFNGCCGTGAPLDFSEATVTGNIKNLEGVDAGSMSLETLMKASSSLTSSSDFKNADMGEIAKIKFKNRPAGP